MKKTLNHYVSCLKGQTFPSFLKFDGAEPNSAELVNNYDWMKEFSFLEFIREVGKNITVNYMMAKDSVKKRLTGEGGAEGMSFHRIFLPIITRFTISCICTKKKT